MDVKPILGPLLALLKSRKFLLAVAGVLFLLINALADGTITADEGAKLGNEITIVIGLLMATIAAEDVAEKVNKK